MESYIEKKVALERQLKNCGHFCYPSSTLNCCACMDNRPILDGNLYPVYIDSIGWCNEGARNDGYCPVCNPKNYETWERKIEEQRREKMLNVKILQEKQLIERQKEEEDHKRAAGMKTTDETFEYSNGNRYIGTFIDGKRNGWGRMDYFDGSFYEGEWKEDEHDGYGRKNWCDGIEYSGEWKNGMMDGRGKYVMADGTVIEGVFREDEYIE